MAKDDNGYHAVSVPSRGLRYLNMTLEEFLRNPMDGFRPLTGIKVSEQPFLQVFNRNENCFRPLTGIKVSEQLKK